MALIHGKCQHPVTDLALRLRTFRSPSLAAGSLTNCLIVAVGTLPVTRSSIAVSAADGVLFFTHTTVLMCFVLPLQPAPRR